MSVIDPSRGISAHNGIKDFGKCFFHVGQLFEKKHAISNVARDESQWCIGVVVLRGAPCGCEVSEDHGDEWNASHASRFLIKSFW